MATSPEQFNVPAQLVKELRERTGAGFSDCRNALAEAAGDLDRALDILRRKGQATAQKKPVYELRIYKLNSENKQHFHDRFRDQCIPIMKRYGFDIVFTSETTSMGAPEFVYLLRWPDDEARSRAWKAFLADPESYGRGSVDKVKRIDTHAASVFLTPDRVLKVKRAVRFPFLDYSTLAKRKAACDAELAVNAPREAVEPLKLDLRLPYLLGRVRGQGRRRSGGGTTWLRGSLVRIRILRQ